MRLRGVSLGVSGGCGGCGWRRVFATAQGDTVAAAGDGAVRFRVRLRVVRFR